MSLGVAIGYNPGLQSLGRICDADLSSPSWLTFDEPINGSRKADAKCLKLPGALKCLTLELRAQAIGKSPQGGYLRPLDSAEGFRIGLEPEEPSGDLLAPIKHLARIRYRPSPVGTTAT